MPDDDKGGKTGEMTTEELQAAAKRAEEKLAAEKAAREEAERKLEEERKRREKEDDDDIDPDEIKDEKTQKYLKKLKDENAQRRIANKKAEEKLTTLETQLEEATKALQAATTKIAEFDEKSEAQKAKERTDLENATKKIEELSKKIDDMTTERQKSEAELATTKRQVTKQARENMIERLVKEKDVSFRSDFEREGFLSKLTKMEGDNFELNNDEVIYEVLKFVESAKAGEEKRVPGQGPGNRQSSTPIGDEIQSLLKTPVLSKEQRARLDELLKLSAQLPEKPKGSR
jgi:chromosome segregation ATPase